MGIVVGIGALGGSGTRAVAQVLIDAGIYMGDDLNKENDNLIFTRLFKNPKWLAEASPQSITNHLRVFEAYMSKDSLTLLDAMTLIKASVDNPTFRDHKTLAKNIFRKLRNAEDEKELWGWKEPNTQVLIEDLCRYFRDFMYIHVVRHGLDMAFSGNKKQLKNWGPRYEVKLDGSETDEEIAYKQLDYWVRSTKDTIEKAKNRCAKLLLVNHTKFCSQPKAEVTRIIEFLEIDIPAQKLESLQAIPRNTGSNNRYRKFDIGIFDEKQIDFVKEMGFEI